MRLHADPTPNSRGQQSDHTSLKDASYRLERQQHWLVSKIRGLDFPAASYPKILFAHRNVKKQRKETLERPSPRLTYVYIYIYLSTCLWFNIDYVQSNICVHYTQTDWAVSSYTDIRGYLVADIHRTALEHC